MARAPSGTRDFGWSVPVQARDVGVRERPGGGEELGDGPLPVPDHLAEEPPGLGDHALGERRREGWIGLLERLGLGQVEPLEEE